MGTRATETKKLIPNTPSPMGHSSLREFDDLEDSHYDFPMRFDPSGTFLMAGAILVVLSALGIGFALGLLHAAQ